MYAAQPFGIILSFHLATWINSRRSSRSDHIHFSNKQTNGRDIFYNFCNLTYTTCASALCEIISHSREKSIRRSIRYTTGTAILHTTDAKYTSAQFPTWSACHPWKCKCKSFVNSWILKKFTYQLVIFSWRPRRRHEDQPSSDYSGFAIVGNVLSGDPKWRSYPTKTAHRRR